MAGSALDRDDVLDEPTWRARAAAHRARTERWTLPHRERRRRHEAHPVLDFLFTYYSHRPAQLEQWHPGPGIALRDADAFLAVPGHVRRPDGTVALDPAALPDRHRTTAAFVRALLVATASLPVHCTHHDAYRFFTAAARPRNAVTPTRADQVALEQPGCLHATMDLYKWAYKLSPATPGELLVDCFSLAADVRELDMRASPYDLTDLGHPPVRIETAAGRAEYARAQAGFARRAAPLRDRLIDLCDTLLA
jgi:hypothetical protein